MHFSKCSDDFSYGRRRQSYFLHNMPICSCAEHTRVLKCATVGLNREIPRIPISGRPAAARKEPRFKLEVRRNCGCGCDMSDARKKNATDPRSHESNEKEISHPAL